MAGHLQCLNMVFTGLLVTVLSVLPGIEGFAQPIRIQPLGNSITQASYPRYSYRYNLWTKLLDDGFDFDFVGSMQNNKNGNPEWPQHLGLSFDQDHEGHSGWTAYQLWSGNNNEPTAGTLSDWLQTYTPDVSLVHIGTNDISQSNFTQSGINTIINFRISRLIDTLRAYNPAIVIFLAQIIPRDDSIRNYWTNYFNANLPNLQVSKYSPTSPIIIVDQNTGFDKVADTYDGVHPNASGEEKIAQKWRDAILDYYWGFNLDITVFLEGPYNGTGMNTALNQYLPLGQPFNIEPWNYGGSESVDTIPPDIVDWVLVELRNAPDVVSAIETTVLARKALFLSSSGKVVNHDGTSLPGFAVNVTDSLFVVVRHRNHLPVISAVPLVKSMGKYTYSFASSNAAYGNTLAQTDLGNGFYAMISGDINQDGIIDPYDKSEIWYIETGNNGYYSSDLNLDGQVDNKDKVEFWEINVGRVSILP
jgi:hypothetical protein